MKVYVLFYAIRGHLSLPSFGVGGGIPVFEDRKEAEESGRAIAKHLGYNPDDIHIEVIEVRNKNVLRFLKLALIPRQQIGLFDETLDTNTE